MSISEEYRQLSELPLFENLKPAQLKRLIFVSERYQLQPGDYLFREGDPTDMVFAILEGEFSIFVDTPNGEYELSVLNVQTSAEVVGEMGVILGEPRSASVRANSPCDVIGFESELFLSTVTNDPQTALKLMQLLAARLAGVDRNLGSQDRSLGG